MWFCERNALRIRSRGRLHFRDECPRVERSRAIFSWMIRLGSTEHIGGRFVLTCSSILLWQHSSHDDSDLYFYKTNHAGCFLIRSPAGWLPSFFRKLNIPLFSAGRLHFRHCSCVTVVERVVSMCQGSAASLRILCAGFATVHRQTSPVRRNRRGSRAGNLSALHGTDQFRTNPKHPAFLFQIADNLAIDHLRSRTRFRQRYVGTPWSLGTNSTSSGMSGRMRPSTITVTSTREVRTRPWAYW